MWMQGKTLHGVFNGQIINFLTIYGFGWFQSRLWEKVREGIEGRRGKEIREQIMLVL